MGYLVGNFKKVSRVETRHRTRRVDFRLLAEALKARIERLCLSLLMSYVFFVFRDSYVLWTSHVHFAYSCIWLGYTKTDTVLFFWSCLTSSKLNIRPCSGISLEKAFARWSKSSMSTGIFGGAVQLFSVVLTFWSWGMGVEFGDLLF